jgi:hypothetical protein
VKVDEGRHALEAARHLRAQALEAVAVDLELKVGQEVERRHSFGGYVTGRTGLFVAGQR